MNALNSIPGRIISGVAVAIIVFVIVPRSGSMNCRAMGPHPLGCDVVGLLCYVVVAQVPALGAAAADGGGPGAAGITKYVAPRVLLSFSLGGYCDVGSRAPGISYAVRTSLARSRSAWVVNP